MLELIMTTMISSSYPTGVHPCDLDISFKFTQNKKEYGIGCSTVNGIYVYEERLLWEIIKNDEKVQKRR